MPEAFSDPRLIAGCFAAAAVFFTFRFIGFIFRFLLAAAAVLAAAWIVLIVF